MISISNISEMQKKIQNLKNKGKIISFVPTMGALHAGHLSLVESAKRKSDVVIVSIFVNPLQFGPNEDLKKYPRPIENDKKMLRKLGVDVLFNPRWKDMYPENYSTYVTEEMLSKTMCGLSRPGHFKGVMTVVLKLFNIIRPDIAFFGQKDYQQVTIIKKMVKDLNVPIEIEMMPIIREDDGLAMSSRNRYLGLDERKNAIGLYNALKMKKLSKKIPGVKLEYFVAVEKNTLKPCKKIKKGVVLAIAGRVGKTRLIDNIIV
jgi:pantoate--beta-alanine ligase